MINIDHALARVEGAEGWLHDDCTREPQMTHAERCLWMLNNMGRYYFEESSDLIDMRRLSPPWPALDSVLDSFFFFFFLNFLSNESRRYNTLAFET